MISRRLALVLPAVALLAPTPALAHGDQILVIVYFPPMIVPGAMLLTVWGWKASLGRKLLSIIAVASASAACFGLFLGILNRYIPFPDSAFSFFTMVFAQVAVPAVVWYACWRKATRRHVVGDL